MRYAHVLVRRVVISPSALSLMYPVENIEIIRATNSSTIC